MGRAGAAVSYESDRKAKVKATPTAEQAAGVISWLRGRLEEELRLSEEPLRTAIESMLLILRLHTEVAAVDEHNQRVWLFRAKCASESWTCYGDGEELVQAPCLHVRLLARPFAPRPDFPRLLAVNESELAAA